MSGEISRSALNEAVGHFVEWLAKNRLAFSIHRTNDPLRRINLLKPLAEYGLCNELLLSCGIREEELVENLHWAWNEVERGDVLVRLLLARPDTFCTASVYAPFRRAGYQNERLDIVLREVSRLRSTEGMEMQAWVRLGFKHAMSGIQESPNESICSQARTWLLQQPEPWCISDDIMYSMTHEVFYASDFGRSECSLPANVIRYLELWVPAWAQCYIDQENWDLTAELAMVGDCLKTLTWDTDPLTKVLEQQESHGHIPGPDGAGGLLIDPSEREQQIKFFGLYHSTLVGAMAAGMRLRRVMSS